MAVTVYTDSYEIATGSYVRAKLVYNTSETDTSYTISVTVTLQHYGAAWSAALYGYLAAYKSSVAKTSNQMSFSQHGSWTDIVSASGSETITKTKASQSVSRSFDVYKIMPVVSKTITFTVPAKTSYPVTFDANGGGSAPAAQVKWYNENLTITRSKPSRDGFSFVKWNTAANGSGTDYAPSSTYSANAPLYLYAIWSAIPKVESLTAIRCDSSGTEDDSGEYAYVEVAWSCDTTVNPGDSGTLSGTITPQGGSASSITFTGDTSGSGGTATAIIPNMDTDTQYTVSVTAANGSLSYTRNVILTRAFFIMDFKAGGEGIGIGRAAPASGLEIGYKASFDDDATFLGDTTILGDVKVGSTAANAKKTLPYLVFGATAWTSANLSACKAAVADYRPCVARFSNGAVVEFDDDPQTDSFS